MPVLHLGDHYYPNRTTAPPGPVYNFRGGEHELVVAVERMTAAERDSFRFGASEFGLVVEPEFLLLVYRFAPAIPWSDAPYTYHLVAPVERLPPVPIPRENATTRAVLHVVALEATLNTVEVLRILTLSNAFTRSLHAAITAQATRRWCGRATYDRLVEHYYSTVAPTSKSALRHAVARCAGGD